MFVNVDSTVFVQNVRVYVLSPYRVSHIGVSDSLAVTSSETQRKFLTWWLPRCVT